jgi:ribosome biogenesis protein ERB1
LTNDDLSVILSIEKGKFPPGYEPYRDYVDWLEHDSRFPLFGTHEPKKNFQPDKGEHKKIVEIMRKMRSGEYKKQEPARVKPMYLMWGEDNNLIGGEKIQHRRTLQAPKLTLPGHRKSYNPPEEYGTKIYPSLREVPVDKSFVLDRYNRCLDLYLAPRHEVIKKKVINPEALLPDLPKPEELRPFPEILSVIYEGHEHIVRSISIDPTGKWMVSASDDATVRLWEVDTGRCSKIWKFADCDISNVEWNPNPEVNVFGVTVDNLVYLIQPKETSTKEINLKTSLLFPEEHEESIEVNVESKTKTDRTKILLKWQFKTDKSLRDQGIVLCLEHLKTVTQITWHPKGDYFATLSPEAYNDGIIIHQLSKAQSQKPFKKAHKLKGIKLHALSFHPTKPYFVVMTQKSVKIYNLTLQKLHKKLEGKSTWYSSLAIHPSGDHLITGGFDRKLEWFDIDISSTSFKTLKYHSKAVRAVAFHPTYPLFATCSDDAYIRIFHCTVFDDWVRDPMIVPVKILKAHKRTSDLGILDLKFHPTQPWLFTSGADKSIRLFTS